MYSTIEPVNGSPSPSRKTNRSEAPVARSPTTSNGNQAARPAGVRHRLPDLLDRVRQLAHEPQLEAAVPLQQLSVFHNHKVIYQDG